MRPANAVPAAGTGLFPDRRVLRLFHIGRHLLFQQQAVACEAVRRSRYRVDEEVNTLISHLRGAKVDWQLEVYSGTEHGFTNPKNASEERADREYKVAMARFFREVFGRELAQK